MTAGVTTLFNGANRTVRSIPSVTTVVTLETFDNEQSFVALRSAYIVVGTASTISAWLDDGSTQFPLIDAEAFGANSRTLIDFGGMEVKVDDILKVQTSNADEVAFYFNFTEVGR